MAHFSKYQKFRRLKPHRVPLHNLLVRWSEWVEKYAKKSRFTVEEIGRGGIMSNKRRKLFPVPFDVQRMDLAVAALNRSDKELGTCLYGAYLGVGLYEDRGAAIGVTRKVFVVRSREARNAVGTCFQLLRSRDLLGRAVLLLARETPP